MRHFLILLFALTVSASASAVNTYGCFNVKDYGAVGNNSTDDTTAIKAAVAAAGTATIVENGSTITKGGCVYFPAGVYVVSSTITFPARVSPQGDGSGGALGGSENSPGASVIRGTMNAPILSFPNDRFAIRDIGVVGPNNASYTSSVCVKVGPTNAYNFSIAHVYASYCYDGILIDGAFNGKLDDITAQFNHRNGIRAMSAQGAWSGINVVSNQGDGLYMGSGSVNNTASPWITSLQTFNNGGYGVNVQGGGLSVSEFFINNDYLGGINLGASASTSQIANGQLQYSGASATFGTNFSAPGVYIASGFSQNVEISGVQFFDDQGIDIDIASPAAIVGITGCTMLGAGKGGVTTAMYAVKSVAAGLRVSNIYTNQSVSFSGNYSSWNNSFISSNGSAPSFNVAGGVNHNLTGLQIYQNSTSGKGFVSASGSSYSIAAVRVYGGSQSSGTMLPGFANSP